jgi:hypothetical protein
MDANATLLLETELRTVADAAVRGAAKYFQVWLHRRWVLEQLLLLLDEEGDPSSSSGSSGGRRLLLLRQELKWSWEGLVGGGVDPKNVHAWSHRRWVLNQAMLRLQDGEQHAVCESARVNK